MHPAFPSFSPSSPVQTDLHPWSNLSGFNCTETENVTSLSILRRRSWLALRAKVDEQTADTILLSKLRTAFEERFRYDEHGVPRVWKPEDDIDEAFRKAKDEVRHVSFCSFFRSSSFLFR